MNRRRSSRSQQPVKKTQSARINEQIRVPEVRLVDADGTQAGIVPTEEAQIKAEEQELDLVEVAPKANPPVCKIMDYGKYLYEQSRKERESRKKQHVIHMKEIRLRPKIEQHDFEFKVKNTRKFIERGDKVKITVFFRGREIVHQEFGAQVLERLIEAVEDIAKIETPMKKEGRNLIVYLAKK